MITRPLSRAAARAVALAMALAIGADTAWADGLGATAQPLDPREPGRVAYGEIVLLAGFVLSMDDPRFGGFSGLAVDPDGARLTALSDRANWLEVALEHDADGRLTGFGAARMAPLADWAGGKLGGLAGDAEALARLPAGGFAVSFERRPRIDAYLLGLDVQASPLVGRANFAAMPSNSGLEAMAVLRDGRIVAFVEAAGQDGAHPGYLLSPKGTERFSYATEPEFAPTDVAELPDGDLLVLERKFNVVEGASARLTRVAGADVTPGATVSGTELARLAPPLATDNFEGLAVRAAPGGGTLVYIISDDNFRPFQRTLVYQFRISD
jgi:hypothetical protein